MRREQHRKGGDSHGTAKGVFVLRQAGRLLSSTTSITYHLAGKGHVDGVAVGLHLPTTREFQEEHHDELMGSVDHVPLTPVIVHSFSNKHRRFRNGREGVVRVVRGQESRTPRPIILGRSTMMNDTDRVDSNTYMQPSISTLYTWSNSCSHARVAELSRCGDIQHQQQQQ